MAVKSLTQHRFLLSPYNNENLRRLGQEGKGDGLYHGQWSIGPRLGYEMKRRMFMARANAVAGLLATPRLARGAAATTLKFVPQADVAQLDPIQSPTGTTIMHSFMIFDTLYGLDENYKAQPQMVDGHVVDNDGKTWKLTLREGLKFHNGEPVLARDVVASLQRWGNVSAHMN